MPMLSDYSIRKRMDLVHGSLLRGNVYKRHDLVIIIFIIIKYCNLTLKEP